MLYNTKQESVVCKIHTNKLQTHYGLVAGRAFHTIDVLPELNHLFTTIFMALWKLNI